MREGAVALLPRTDQRPFGDLIFVVPQNSYVESTP